MYKLGDAVELLIDGKPFYELYFARTNGAGDFSWNGDRDDCRSDTARVWLMATRPSQCSLLIRVAQSDWLAGT